MVTKTVKKLARKSLETTKFAEGLHFKKLFFVFLIGSVFGAIYEDILIYIQTWHDTGTGVWMLHRGVIYGPFNVIYGFGAVAMCLLLCRHNYKSWQIFLIATLLGGGIEYFVGLAEEKVLHVISWDYSHEFLNINGRTTLPFMLVWGLMGLLFVKVVYPWLSKWIERIPRRIGEVAFLVLLIFMISDVTVSWTALIRQSFRHHNIPALTPIGKLCDQIYPDSFLQKYFPNMRTPEDE